MNVNAWFLVEVVYKCENKIKPVSIMYFFYEQVYLGSRLDIRQVQSNMYMRSPLLSSHLY